MKKTRIMALALTVAVMLMGAGYAAWTDTLTITNTVNTGKLDVNFVEGKVAWNSDNQEVAKNDEVTFNEDVATINLKNLYPGANATVTLKVKNESTIPVKDATFNFTGATDWCTISPVQLPAGSNLAPGETKDLVFVIEVPLTTEGHYEDNATITATATYNQFNN